MEYITQTRIELMNMLELIFVKWWQVGTLYIATFISAFFGEALLLFITPGDVKEWWLLVLTISLGIMTAFFFQVKKRREIRHMDEKNKQELEQDALDKYIEQYETMRNKGLLKPESTLEDFVAQIKNITNGLKP